MKEYFYRKKTRFLVSPGYLVMEVIACIAIVFTGFWGWHIAFAKFFIDCFVSVSSPMKPIDSMLPLSLREKRNYAITKSVLDAVINSSLILFNILVSYRIYTIEYGSDDYYIFEALSLLLVFLLMLVIGLDRGKRLSGLDYFYLKNCALREKIEILVLGITELLLVGLLYPIQITVLNRGSILMYRLEDFSWKLEEFEVVGIVFAIILMLLYLYQILTYSEYYYLEYDISDRILGKSKN